MAIAAAYHIGRFEVIAPIGAGGMGEVFRARDPEIRREVAIKVLPAAYASDRERLSRFEQEARAAGSLSHPNLITIYELGIDDGAPYIAMELLEGVTLREKLRRAAGGLPPRVAVEIAIQVASGLAAAHEKRLVHRDLKPENIFLTKSGQAKILDFGVVKLAGNRDTLDSVQPTLPQTAPGAVVGTTGYMSPEQVTGGEVGQRSDIFSLGAVLYEMLSGRRAFHGATTVDTMSAILHEEPAPLGSDSNHVPPALERIVRRCLEKEPGRRFDSAHDVMLALDALGDVSSGGTAGDEAPQPRRRSLALRLVVLTASAAALVLGGLWFGRRTASLPKTPGTIPKLVRLTAEAGIEFGARISPDGAHFVYVAGPAENRDIFLRRVGGETAIDLTKDCPAEDTMPAFSPDGRSIAFRSACNGGGIFIMGATGESPRRLTDFGYSPAWSPDGKSIAISTDRPDGRSIDQNSEIWVVDVGSGSRKRVFLGSGEQPAWSPSGLRIAFTWRPERWGWKGSAPRGFAVATIPATGGVPVVAFENRDMNGRSPVWTRRGIFFRAVVGETWASIWRVPVDESTGVRTGEIEPVVRTTAIASSLSSTVDGQKLLFVAAEIALTIRQWEFDASAAKLLPDSRVVISGGRDVRAFGVSPKADWVAGALFDEDRQDVAVVDTRSGEIRRVTNEPFRSQFNGVSADGSSLYFNIAPEGRHEIWRVRPDGSGREPVARGGPNEDLWDAQPSPDGRLLYVRAGTEMRPNVVDLTAPFGSRKLAPLPPMPDGRTFGWPPSLSPAVSPNGAWIAGYGRGPSLKAEPPIVLFDVARRTYREIAKRAAVETIDWLPDSRRLLLWAKGELNVLDSATGAITPAGKLDENVRYVVLSPDGRRLFTTSSVLESDIWMLDFANPVSLEGFGLPKRPGAGGGK